MSHTPALPIQTMGVMYRPAIVAPQLKRCWLCEEELPVSEFGPDRARKDGLQIADRFCLRAYNRERYALARRPHSRGNPYASEGERVAARRATWRASNKRSYARKKAGTA